MVDAPDQNQASTEGQATGGMVPEVQAATGEAASGGTGEQANGGDEWVTSNTAELDADEEAKLAEFLQKVTQAAKNDPSVPSFVGEQTSSWL